MQVGRTGFDGDELGSMAASFAVFINSNSNLGILKYPLPRTASLTVQNAPLAWKPEDVGTELHTYGAASVQIAQEVACAYMRRPY
jgi:hypothetical protein